MAKKHTLKENAAAITLLGGIYVTTFALVGAGLAIYEKFGVDHTKDKCRLCDILGLEHQATVINKDYDSNYYACYKEATEEQSFAELQNAEEIINEDGSISYVIPEGYVMVSKGILMKETIIPAEEEKVEVYEKETNELVRTFK